MTRRPARFSKVEWEAARGRVVPDLLPDPLRLLFVGINPGLWTAATGAHFARPGNRFYPALFRAGITDTLIDASAGYTDADRDGLLGRGIGITNLCSRPTARAAEVSRPELRAGAERLAELVVQHRPRVVAVLGITAYRQAFDAPGATVGRQPAPWGDAPALFALPNPSGLNAHASLQDLADAYGEAARTAGVLP